MEKPLTRRSGLFPRQYAWGLVLLAGLALLATITLQLIASHRPAPSSSEREQNPVSVSRGAFEAATGLRVTLVATTAGGGMIDLRYQVIDPDKAILVHNPDTPPTIVDEATGETFSTPWMQHTHNRPLKAGITYYLVLVNSKGGIKPGDFVTVVIGDYRLEHVIVQ